MKIIKLFAIFTLVLLGFSVQAQLTVSINGNTTICQGTCTTLSATASGGTPAYTYNWIPSGVVSSALIVCPSSSTNYTVQVTDGVGSTATGTVTVIVDSLPIITISEACDGITATLTASGGAMYQWSNDGWTTSQNTATILVSATLATTYTVVGTNASNCNDTVTIALPSPSCAQNVWPGDCNYDLSANNFDVLTLGMAYGATGSTRPSASNNWAAQPSVDWLQGFPGGINYKHSDCNGDGVVNDNDTLAISLNYGQTHPFKLLPPVYNNAIPDLYLVATVGFTGPNTLVNVDIMLGTNTLPIDSIYALAFTINYNPTYLLNAFDIGANFGGSWMGTIGNNMLSLQKNFFSSGMLDLGITRINHTNILGGSGKIGTFTFRTTPVTSVGPGYIMLTISDVKAITVTGSIVSLNTKGDSVYFMPNALTGIASYLNPDLISIYPNPATENITLTLPSELKNVKIEMVNLIGQTILENEIANPAFKLDVSSLPVGMYQMKLTCDEGVVTKKVQVVKK